MRNGKRSESTVLRVSVAGRVLTCGAGTVALAAGRVREAPVVRSGVVSPEPPVRRRLPSPTARVPAPTRHM